MKKASFSIFVNPKFEKTLSNGPTLRATGQVIVWLNEKEEYVIDDITLVDIDEIELMGVTISAQKEKNKTLDHFDSMGICLWQIMEKELIELVSMSGDAKTFVFEQTGIKL